MGGAKCSLLQIQQESLFLACVDGLSQYFADVSCFSGVQSLFRADTKICALGVQCTYTGIRVIAQCVELKSKR